MNVATLATTPASYLLVTNANTALAASVNQCLPHVFPAAHKDLVINALDQGLLGREIAIQQGMRDAEPGCEVACLAADTVLRKKTELQS